MHVHGRTDAEPTVLFQLAGASASAIEGRVKP
jgi:hypothetical protein